MSTRDFILVAIAGVSAGWGGYAWWRWRRHVSKTGDETERQGLLIIELLRAILDELRGRK